MTNSRRGTPANTPWRSWVARQNGPAVAEGSIASVTAAPHQKTQRVAEIKLATSRFVFSSASRISRHKRDVNYREMVMTRFRSAFAVPSGFAVATRAAAAAKAGKTPDVSVGGSKVVAAGTRVRQTPVAAPADRAA